MRSWRRALGYGLLVWLIPFVVAVCAFSLKENWRSLFESVMAVAVAATVVGLGAHYFLGVGQTTPREGFLLGITWLMMSVAIDLPLMLSPPINYSLAEYAADIGLTYVMIPIITLGLAIVGRRANLNSQG